MHHSCVTRGAQLRGYLESFHVFGLKTKKLTSYPYENEIFVGSSLLFATGETEVFRLPQFVYVIIFVTLLTIYRVS